MYVTFCLWTQFVGIRYTMSKKQTPSDFLKLIIGRPVMVKLNSGVDYRGTVTFCYLSCVFTHHAAVSVCVCATMCTVNAG